MQKKYTPNNKIEAFISMNNKRLAGTKSNKDLLNTLFITK